MATTHAAGTAGPEAGARVSAAGRRLRRPGAAGLGGILDCMHCGICLPQCPTYRVLGQEMDSPRGRVYLMRAAAEGRIGLTENFVLHMDRCLGCRACETRVPRRRPVRAPDRGDARADRAAGAAAPRPADPGQLLLGVFPERQRLARLLTLTRLYQRSGLQRLVARSGLLRRLPRLGAMERLLPTLSAAPADRLAGRDAPAERLTSRDGRGPGGMRPVAALPRGQLARPCASLARAGYRVVVPRGRAAAARSTSTGATGHAGRALARRNVARPSQKPTGSSRTPRAAARRSATTGISSATTRGQLALAARVRDVSELLAEHLPGPRATARPHRDLPRALPPRPRPARPEAPRAHPARDPGAPARGALRVRLSAAGRPASTTSWSRRSPGSCSIGSSTGSRHAAPAVVASGNPDASSSSVGDSPTAACAVRAYHPVELLAWSVEGTRPRSALSAWSGIADTLTGRRAGTSQVSRTFADSDAARRGTADRQGTGGRRAEAVLHGPRGRGAHPSARDR